MTKLSCIDQATVDAYRQSHYCVDTSPPFHLEVGVINTALLALYRQSGVDCCTYITACNPFSEVITDTDNEARQAEFARKLHQRSLVFLPGIGAHPDDPRPGEPSYLVLGLSLEAARKLGAAHEQNAIIWCGPDAVPQLILLR